MEYEFADRTVEYVDAKAIRSFWALQEETSLFPGKNEGTGSFPHSSTHRSELEHKHGEHRLWLEA